MILFIHNIHSYLVYIIYINMSNAIEKQQENMHPMMNPMFHMQIPYPMMSSMMPPIFHMMPPMPYMMPHMMNHMPHDSSKEQEKEQEIAPPPYEEVELLTYVPPPPIKDVIKDPIRETIDEPIEVLEKDEEEQDTKPIKKVTILEPSTANKSYANETSFGAMYGAMKLECTRSTVEELQWLIQSSLKQMETIGQHMLDFCQAHKMFTHMKTVQRVKALIHDATNTMQTILSSKLLSNDNKNKLYELVGLVGHTLDFIGSVMDQHWPKLFSSYFRYHMFIHYGFLKEMTKQFLFDGNPWIPTKRIFDIPAILRSYDSMSMPETKSKTILTKETMKKETKGK
jgi:hypothetical protein